MKQTIGLTQFRDAFHNMGRSNNFSYEGLELLFNHLEELDENMELDVIAICCDFFEDTVEDIISNYNLDAEAEGLDETDKHALVVDYLNDNTFLLGKTENNSYLYQQF